MEWLFWLSVLSIVAAGCLFWEPPPEDNYDAFLRMLSPPKSIRKKPPVRGKLH